MPYEELGVLHASLECGEPSVLLLRGVAIPSRALHHVHALEMRHQLALRVVEVPRRLASGEVDAYDGPPPILPRGIRDGVDEEVRGEDLAEGGDKLVPLAVRGIFMTA